MCKTPDPPTLLCQRHPVLYWMSVWQKRILRYFHWYFGSGKAALHKSTERLSYRVKKHQSVLVRKLGDSDIQLQYNKIVNLKIAVAEMNGILIHPGETFSFCRLVGRPSKLRGFKEGMELSRGEARSGIGGGLCQLANLIHWLVLHSPLTVVERHHHSFDPFPDNGRVLPFGSGATVFYNYKDYSFMNNTAHTFQLNFWFSEKCLEGELRCTVDLPYSYHVFEREHAFVFQQGKYFRKNEIWRNTCDKKQQGRIVKTELIGKNFAEVKYEILLQDIG